MNESVRLTIGQEIDDAASLQVHQEGPVGMTPAKREIVDAQNAGRRMRGTRKLLDPSKQCVGARRGGQTPTGSRSCFAPPSPVPRRRARPSIDQSSGHGAGGVCEAFAEHLPRAFTVRTTKPPDDESSPNPSTLPRKIGERADIATMDGLRAATTNRTSGVSRRHAAETTIRSSSIAAATTLRPPKEGSRSLPAMATHPATTRSHP
jgi:hypothetical protein